MRDPRADPVNDPFGRMLWDVAPGARRIVTLDYAFVPRLNFDLEWTTSIGTRVKTDSRGFDDAQKRAPRAAACTGKQRTPMKDNLAALDTRNAPDLEAMALREFGHVLGLGHPHKDNVSTNPKQQLVVATLPVNVNGPPTFPAPSADKNNLQKSNVLQAEVTRARPIAAGTRSTQAVMVQGAIAVVVAILLGMGQRRALSSRAQCCPTCIRLGRRRFVFRA